jgi:hypothetical protein
MSADLTTRGTPRVRARKVPVPKIENVDSLIGAAIQSAMLRSFKRYGTHIPADVVRDAVADADGKCAITGIPFSGAEDAPGRRRPWVPTLDRIDPSKGYVAGNVRLICCAANIALNDWGDDVFWQMVEAAYKARHVA